MDLFIIAQGLKYIGEGIALGFVFFFLSISFFLYLNGREINEYYLIFFGKLKINDIIIIIISCLVLSLFLVLLNFDDILIDAMKQEILFNQLGEKIK
jgi:hypothetical protein